MGSYYHEMFLLCSKFLGNDGGRGGAMSVAYFPLAFNGNTVFKGNTGRTLVVSGPSLNIHMHACQLLHMVVLYKHVCKCITDMMIVF